MSYEITNHECGMATSAKPVGVVLNLQEEHRLTAGSHHRFEFRPVDR